MHVTSHAETAAWLALLPILATFGFYLLPATWQSNLAIQFFPQAIAYIALGLWGFQNFALQLKLGLQVHDMKSSFFCGGLTGIGLGCINTGIILYVVPAFGRDINFLRYTPHAQVPFWIMMPWFILIIAFLVELNFRGFILGRLLTFFKDLTSQGETTIAKKKPIWVLLALGISALTFSFDPFMVNTFKHLHWIAVWDGMIWGWIWIRMNNLYTIIVAHAIEVMILYLIIRASLL